MSGLLTLSLVRVAMEDLGRRARDARVNRKKKSDLTGMTVIDCVN